MLITYLNVNDHVRVVVADDETGTITYTLQSKLFNKWSDEQNITEYYNVI